MANFLIVIALLVWVAAAAARWWFWSRVAQQGRRMLCGLSVGEMNGLLGLPPGKKSALRDAAALGSALREAGLTLLEKDGMAMAKRRRIGWWNLRVLPALIALIAVFSLISKWAPFPWVLAVGALTIAGHVIVRVSGLAIELEAVQRASAELRQHIRFRRSSEEAEIHRCARASVWETILPW